MRIRSTGAIVAIGLAAAVTSLAVIPLFGQARGAAPAAPAGQGRGAAAPAAPAQARPAARPARIANRPNLNGIWQAMGTAHWNLEDHSAAAAPVYAGTNLPFWQLGALYAVPAGQSVIEGGTIPYLPAALKQREENMKGWPKSDPEAKCYMPGIPRATYMPYPFQIVQGQRDILFVYEYASSNRIVHMSNHTEAPVDSWMGWSNGKWDGDTLVIEVNGFNDQTWFDRAGNHHTEALKVTERYSLNGDNHLNYEARIEDPKTFSRPWTIRMPLYRRLEPNVQLLEFKCVEFSEELLYGDLKKK
jgi:hypothetical protein